MLHEKVTNGNTTFEIIFIFELKRGVQDRHYFVLHGCHIFWSHELYYVGQGPQDFSLFVNIYIRVNKQLIEVSENAEEAR